MTLCLTLTQAKCVAFYIVRRKASQKEHTSSKLIITVIIHNSFGLIRCTFVTRLITFDDCAYLEIISLFFIYIFLLLLKSFFFA